MAVSIDGFCTDCHKWVHEHPDLTCPGCGSRKVSPEVLGATDPVGALIDCRTRVRQVIQEKVQIGRNRRDLARHVLNDPELILEARRRGIRLASLDRWAAPPALKACRRGHATADWGDWDGTRWNCRKCAEEGKPKNLAPNVPREKRKDAARLSAAWRAYEDQLAERERLAALDQIPARLNPPMPPPARPA